MLKTYVGCTQWDISGMNSPPKIIRNITKTSHSPSSWYSPLPRILERVREKCSNFRIYTQRLAAFHLSTHWVKVYEPGLEEGSSYSLQGLIHLAVQFDLV